MKFLEVTIRGRQWLVHPNFLLERSPIPRLRDQMTGQRNREYSIENFGEIKQVDFQKKLRILFENGHEMCFEHPNKLVTDIVNGGYPNMPTIKRWTSNVMHRDKLCIDYTSPSYSLHECLQRLISYGAVVVKNIGAHQDSLASFTNAIGFVRNTNWEHFFHVKTNNTHHSNDTISTSDIAYSNQRLDLHVDNPYRDPHPQYQFLHCIEAAPSDGGKSIICDGFKSAELFRERFPKYYQSLVETEVRFQYTDENTTQISKGTIIQTDPKTGTAGNVFTQDVVRIACSTRLDYAPCLEPKKMELFYQARAKWIQHIHDPSLALTWKLQPGDLLIVDNNRVMHGREEFALNDQTKRHLVGCYMDKDSVISKYLTLSKTPNVGDNIQCATLKEVNVEHESVSFTNLNKCTAEDIDLMTKLYNKAATAHHLTERVVSLLRAQDTDKTTLGAKINLYQHGLQCATRAYRDNADEEVIVCALLHDIGELYSPSNHGEIAASILKPYISRKMYWVLANHEIFQGYYYFEHVGIDKNRREHLRDSAPEGAFDLCVQFCERYDAPSFDPNYDTLELTHFIPSIINVFERRPFWDDPANLKSGAVVGE